MGPSESCRRSVRCILEGRFTEADVKAVLIDARQQGLSPIVKDLGDLIAHPTKDQGPMQEHFVWWYAQMAMFTKYNMNNGQTFPTDGSCDWWLKPFLRGQYSRFTAKKVGKVLNRKKKQVQREIGTYFPSNEQFPTELKKLDDRFLDIVNLASSAIFSRPLCSEQQISREMGRLLSWMRIPNNEETNTLLTAAVCVLLSSAKFKLPMNETGECFLGVDEHKPDQLNEGSARALLRIPHGQLNCVAACSYKIGDRTQKISSPLFATGVSTENMISTELIECISHGLYRINLSGPLGFDSSLDRPIIKI